MIARRDFTYAEPSDPKMKRAVIQAIELATGKPRLRRLYNAYSADRLVSLSAGREICFWTEAIRRLDVRVTGRLGALAELPAEGPLVVVANHPYGVLDGLVLGHLVAHRRRDFRLMVHSALTKAEELRDQLLPVDFSETPEALRTNLRSRAEARKLLAAGGALLIFPGGTVSTALGRGGRAFDPAWKPFVAKLVLDYKAAVVPVYFAGQNSRLFQFVSRFSPTLRLSLIFKEVVDRIGAEVEVTVGRPIAAESLAQIGSRQRVVDLLRRETYALGGIAEAPELILPG